MTEKLYYLNPGIQETNVFLNEIENYNSANIALITNATIFYPEGGGQPADKGYIDNIPVSDVIIEDDKILHIINKKFETNFTKKIDNLINMKLDFNTRIDNSTQHSAQHLLSAILYDYYKTQTLSFHLGEDYSTIAIESHNISSEMVNEIEIRVNNAIYENRQFNEFNFQHISEIKNMNLRKQPKIKENIRVIEIDGYDASPCGGTHVKSTGQLGLIKLIKMEKYKSNYRLFFLAGKRSLYDYQNKHKIIKNLVTSFTCNENQIINKIESDQENYRKIVNLNNHMIKKIIRTHIEDIEATRKTTRVLVKIFTEVYEDFNFIVYFSKHINQEEYSYIILASQIDCKLLMISNSDKLSCGTICKNHINQFNGKGGGNSKRAQANFSNKKDLENFVVTVQGAIEECIK